MSLHEKAAPAEVKSGAAEHDNSETLHGRPSTANGKCGPSNSAAIAFLKSVYPDGPWLLTAIDPENGKIETRTFRPEGEHALGSWLAQRNGHSNLYWSVNPPLRPLNKKAEREDIKAVHYLHVDLDPRPGEDFEAERARARKLLEEYEPHPNIILDSGGGMQAFWRLTEPIPINGDLSKAEDAKRYNQQIEIETGADHCHNIDRIMRLPGTINIPDAKKRAKGRSERLASALYQDDGSSPVATFKPAPAMNGAAGTPSVAVDTASVKRLTGVDDLPPSVPDWVKVAIVHGFNPDEPDKYSSRSEALFAVCCALVRAGVDDETHYSVITDPDFKISASVLEAKGVEKYALRQIERAHEGNDAGPLRLRRNDPTATADIFRERHWTTLMHFGDDWLAYDGGAYQDIESETVKASAYDFLRGAIVSVKAGDGYEDAPFQPKQADVAEVMAALKAVAHRPRSTYSPPCWLSGDGPPPTELVACRNGILNLRNEQLLPLSERFFTRNALEFDYDPSAPSPKRWHAFLSEIWPNEADTIATLQEVFGYMLVPDTSQQKIILLVGPLRSGKGTIGRVLTQLVGQRNCCSPSLNSLSAQFGLEPLLGKQLALISDMRLGKHSDRAAIAENLLRLSGEDMVTVNRKFKQAWDGTLSARFVIMTNELPSLDGPSGALANRFVPLVMHQSFLGKEDPGLFNALRPELPGILQWACDGWRRLQERGHFIVPATGQEVIQQLADLASPLHAFLREMCVLDPLAITPKAEVWKAWQDWCARRERPWGDERHFARDLPTAARGLVRTTRPRDGSKRVWSWEGLRLRTPEEDKREDDALQFDWTNQTTQGGPDAVQTRSRQRSNQSPRETAAGPDGPYNYLLNACEEEEEIRDIENNGYNRPLIGPSGPADQRREANGGDDDIPF